MAYTVLRKLWPPPVAVISYSVYRPWLYYAAGWRLDDGWRRARTVANA